MLYFQKNNTYKNFHYNNYQNYFLSLLLKKHKNCKIILTFMTIQTIYRLNKFVKIFENSNVIK